jgi:hypothetical protein
MSKSISEQIAEVVAHTYELEIASDCQEVSHLRDDAAYAAGFIIAEANDPSAWQHCPSWLLQRIRLLWIEPLIANGCIRLWVSSSAQDFVDYSEVARELQKLIPPES